MKLPVTRQQIRNAKTAVNAAYRMAKLQPKALKVFQALQSGAVTDWEAWDEIEEALDRFIERYVR